MHDSLHRPTDIREHDFKDLPSSSQLQWSLLAIGTDKDIIGTEMPIGSMVLRNMPVGEEQTKNVRVTGVPRDMLKPGHAAVVIGDKTTPMRIKRVAEVTDDGKIVFEDGTVSQQRRIPVLTETIASEEATDSHLNIASKKRGFFPVQNNADPEARTDPARVAIVNQFKQLKVPAAQRKAASKYKDNSSYEELNQGLRHGNDMSPAVQKLDEQLDKLTSHRLRSSIIAHRMLSEDFDTSKMKPGAVFQDQGYMSTTVKRSLLGGGAEVFAKSGSPESANTMEILLPAGTQGFYLDAIDGVDNANEHEILLRKNTKLRVISHDPESKHTVMEAIVE